MRHEITTPGRGGKQSSTTPMRCPRVLSITLQLHLMGIIHLSDWQCKHDSDEARRTWHHHRQITYTAQAKPAVGHYISQDYLCVGMHLPFWSRYQNTLSTCDILLVHSRDSFQKSISSCTFPFARCRNTISCCHMWERDQLTFQIIVHFLIKGMVHGAQFVHTPFSHDAAV